MEEIRDVDVDRFFSTDIVRHRLTGLLPSTPDYRIVNFVQSTLHQIVAISTDFSECDFKDSLIRDARFRDCIFDGATFATSFFSNCIFQTCRFYNLAAHSCEFHEVSFDASDLTNLLVKSSVFRHCSFRSCKTSNRIAEMSALNEVEFIGTDIQIETITENFGLRKADLTGSRIRSGRIRQDYVFLEETRLAALLDSARLSPIERLRVHFFLLGSLIDGTPHLDRSLDLGHWTAIYRNPGSFVELLDRFSEFLLSLYDSERLTLQPLLLLHYVTGSLTCSERAHTNLHRVALALGGTHLLLSRVAEEYLDVLDRLSHLATSRGFRLTFLVEGDDSLEFFSKGLLPWIDGEGVRISRLAPRNSPLELEVLAKAVAPLLPLIAIFLATRTRLELLRLRSKLSTSEATSPKAIAAQGQTPTDTSDPREHRSSALTKAEPDSLFLLEVGPKAPREREYQLQVRSLLPGSLIFDLRLNINTQLAGKVRRLLVDLLSADDKERR